MNDEALTTYLDDHLSGSIAGKERAAKCGASNPDTPLVTFLQDLNTKMDEGREVVKDLLERVGGEVNAVKVAVGWLGEKASRIKLGHPLQMYTPLNRLEQVEGLAVGSNVGRGRYGKL